MMKPTKEQFLDYVRIQRSGKGAIMVNIITKKTLREYLSEYNPLILN